MIRRDRDESDPRDDCRRRAPVPRPSVGREWKRRKHHCLRPRLRRSPFRGSNLPFGTPGPVLNGSIERLGIPRFTDRPPSRPFRARSSPPGRNRPDSCPRRLQPTGRLWHHGSGLHAPGARIRRHGKPGSADVRRRVTSVLAVDRERPMRPRRLRCGIRSGPPGAATVHPPAVRRRRVPRLGGGGREARRGLDLRTRPRDWRTRTGSTSSARRCAVVGSAHPTPPSIPSVESFRRPYGLLIGKDLRPAPAFPSRVRRTVRRSSAQLTAP